MTPKRSSRRRQYLGFAVVALILLVVAGVGLQDYWMPAPTAQGVEFRITEEEERILLATQKMAFDFFWNECNTDNGLVKDRTLTKHPTPIQYAPCSVAAVGYALSAYVVGVQRGWVSREDAYNRCLTTLRFFKRVQNVHGFFYHFLDMNSGVRTWRSELSPIDTTLFLAGALHAGMFFQGTEVERLARELYEAVDWPWMLNGGTTLALGWNPEDGFQEWRWDHYSEANIMYLLAIGSPTHPIPASSWDAFSRPIGRYKDYVCIASPPLFTHQYSQIWVDFRNKHDRYGNYFENSIIATKANRQFCIDNMSLYSTYGPNHWGLTACQAPDGYRAYGAKPGRAVHDGTIAPTGAIGSIPFTPRESIDYLVNLYKNHPELWGPYGPTDAYNFHRKWQAQEVLAIDQGTILLMIENFLTGSVWREFSKFQPVQEAMTKVGFRPGQGTFDYEELVVEYFESDPARRPSAVIPYRATPVKLDGDPADWGSQPLIHLAAKTNLEYGSYDRVGDVGARVQLAWDEKNLYLLAVVEDDELVTHTQTPDKLYQDDGLEIFIDPTNNNLQWGSPSEFQIGFSPSGPPGQSGPRKWCWFQSSNGGDHIRVSSSKRANDYVIEASIAWSFLGIQPAADRNFGFTIAINDKDVSNSAKLTWFFKDPGILLGHVVLGGKP